MIKNITRGTVLCRTCEAADSSWKRAIGLMFRKSMPRGHGLLMTFERPSRPGIWMFGMRFPIDIVFIGPDRRVVHTVQGARPLGFGWRTWRIYMPPRDCTHVLELPAGTVRETGTRQGDVLEF
jgi:uncharacterized membrane protein (UPF0127 family)